jgi:hypothetical protein
MSRPKTKLIIQATRNSKYSTGRGGAGNIRKYNPQEVRVAQDVPTGPIHIPVATAAGRGGVGNLQAAKKRETQRRASMNEGRASQDSARSAESSSSRGSNASLSDAGLAAWGKSRLFGRRRSSVTKD